MEWNTPEYEHFDKDAGWYKGVMIITVVAVILSLLLKNIFLALIFLIGGFTIMIYGARQPRITRIRLTPKGVIINKDLYLYHKLKSFAISDHHGENRHHKLIIEADRTFIPHIVILLDGVSDDEVREYLNQYLREVHHEESFVDVIFDLLHF